jgi:hypothetical protein
MFATGRSSFGKATAGVPGSARKSCAETDVMNPAAKTAAIVIRRAKDGLWAIRRPLNVLWKYIIAFCRTVQFE